MPDIYATLIEHVRKLWKEHDLFEERVHVKARALSLEEAVGNPESDDFTRQE